MPGMRSRRSQEPRSSWLPSPAHEPRADLSIGQRIRVLRKDRQLNQQQLAGLIGKSPSWLYLVESGKLSRLDMDTVQEFARVLRVRAVDITGPLYDPLATRGIVAHSENEGPVVLAILPLGFTPTGALDAFLVSGFCEDIVARLSKLHSLRIVGAGSADHHGPEADWRSAPGIGKSMGAAAVLAGSLRECSDKLHLNIHLVDTETSVTLWSETFDFTYQELGDARARVSASVADALRLRLSPNEIAGLSDRSTDVVKAYEFYLRAVGLLATNQEEDLAVALSMLTRATELDQSFPDAHALRGYALWRKYFCGWDADVGTLQLGLESAARAIALDPRSTAARMTRVRIYWDMGWHEQALAEGYSCCQHHPANHDALLTLARAYNNAGMADLCLPLTRHVLQVDPSNPTASKLLIWGHLMFADYATACTVGERYVQVHPGDTNTPWAVCMAQLHLGRFSAAAEMADRVLRSDCSDDAMRGTVLAAQPGGGSTLSEHRVALEERVGTLKIKYSRGLATLD